MIKKRFINQDTEVDMSFRLTRGKREKLRKLSFKTNKTMNSLIAEGVDYILRR